MSLATPTPEDLEELLLSARYGDVDDIQQFVDKFGADALATARDDGGNTVLHMVAGNGHTGTVFLPTPLHRVEADSRKVGYRRVRLPPPPRPLVLARRAE